MLRKFDCDKNSWEIKNVKYPENLVYDEANNDAVKSVFSKMFDINNKDEMNFAERTNHETLFSALISKPTRSDSGISDFQLDIPDLPDEPSMVQWQIPKTANFEWIDYHGLMLAKNRDDFDLPEINFPQKENSDVKSSHEDEGFSSPKSSSLDLVLSDQKETVENPWQSALKLSISEYVDWEMRDQ